MTYDQQTTTPAEYWEKWVGTDCPLTFSGEMSPSEAVADYLNNEMLMEDFGEPDAIVGGMLVRHIEESLDAYGMDQMYREECRF